MFCCACVVALPLFSALGQLSAGPNAVMTGATVLTAAAHIHVSLPHLFKDLVLTDSYHMLAVRKLYHWAGEGRVSGICNRSGQLCVLNTRIWMTGCHSLLTHSACYKKPISCENTCTGRAYMLRLNSCCVEGQTAEVSGSGFLRVSHWVPASLAKWMWTSHWCFTASS